MPERTRILLSWVGHADLLAWAATLPEDTPDLRTVERMTDKEVGAGVATGRVRTAIDFLEFEEVHLVADLEPGLIRNYSGWLDASVEARIVVHHVELDPEDYESAFHAANKVLADMHLGHGPGGPELWIGLSSGTRAMAATLVLLGKSRFPARFLKTAGGSASEVEIPFDLTVDFVPELLREPDANLQLLADRSPDEVDGFGGIIGSSRGIRLAVGQAQRFAVRDVSVLILGETGSGKELFARAIHAASGRREGPFKVINCASIPVDLQESTLFGHMKGAFTGAVSDKEGLFHEADGGTLFLDEFGELDLRTQASLLRVLQPLAGDAPCQRRFRRVGGAEEESSDARIIAATNRDPQEQISTGTLRQDLFYRVATLSLTLPPLRTIRNDIGPIAEDVISRINSEFEKSEPGYEHKQLSRPAIQLLTSQHWPGNVRQLNNVLVHAAALTDHAVLGRPDIELGMASLPVKSPGGPNIGPPLKEGFSLPEYVREVQRHYIQQAYVEANASKTQAAKLLGLRSYQALDSKLTQIGAEWSEDDLG